MSEIKFLESSTPAEWRAIGARVRLLRKQRGLTQDAAAAQVPCTVRTWQRFERGQFAADRNARVQLAQHVARVLQVSVADLTGENGTDGGAQQRAHAAREHMRAIILGTVRLFPAPDRGSKRTLERWQHHLANQTALIEEAVYGADQESRFTDEERIAALELAVEIITEELEKCKGR
jgi:transcriptional regulator with XRE-family HTH domain